MKTLFGLVLVLAALSVDCKAQGLVLKYQDFSQQYEIVAPTRGTQEYPPLFDFDGNGVQDLCWRNANGSITVYTFPGMVPAWTSPFVVVYLWPVFLDVTGDGLKEVLCQVPGSGTYCVFSPATNTCLLEIDSVIEGSCNYFLTDYDGDQVSDILFVVNAGHGGSRREIWGAGTVASSPPSDLVIQPDGDDLILNWQQVDSCSMYRLYWSFALNGEYASIGTSCTPTFTHPGAVIAPRAYYKVAAITSTNEIIIGPATYAAPPNSNPVNLSR
ncbi:VCBS repeat-containing protein [candidate division KSB1 bacterium]|nr:VCBS repeat-containing protein [candidate division KSB1 bacterium]